MKPFNTPANDALHTPNCDPAPRGLSLMTAWGAWCGAVASMGVAAALWPLDLWSAALTSIASAGESLDERPVCLACTLADVSETREALCATRDDFLRALSR